MESPIVLIDKPKGISSFDVIRILRKELGVRKIGHAGTLDPLASGLMILGVGEGTKMLTELVGLQKTYYAEIILGKKTTTGDMEGDIVSKKNATHLTTREVLDALARIVGVQHLPVPAYSAIKRDGEALYKKARRGQPVDAPIKEMKIYSMTLDVFDYETDSVIAGVTMDVSSGSYVRSIAEEIGRLLDVPATTKEIRRLRIGDFDIKDARTVSIPTHFKTRVTPKSA